MKIDIDQGTVFLIVLFLFGAVAAISHVEDAYKQWKQKRKERDDHR